MSKIDHNKIANTKQAMRDSLATMDKLVDSYIDTLVHTKPEEFYIKEDATVNDIFNPFPLIENMSVRLNGMFKNFKSHTDVSNSDGEGNGTIQ